MFIKKFKQFNETKAGEEFAGYPLSYWNDYADSNDETYVFGTDDEDLKDEIEFIINKYNEEDERDFDKERLENNMLKLAHWLILVYGKANAGSLSAYCMQTMGQENDANDIPVVSQKLLNIGNKTGVFNENVDENGVPTVPNPKEIGLQITFHNQHLGRWRKDYAENDVIFTKATPEKDIISEIDGMIEMIEIYNADENPEQIMINKANLKVEVLALANVCITVYGDFDAGIIKGYISDNAQYDKVWKRSTKLKGANKNTGIFEND